MYDTTFLCTYKLLENDDDTSKCDDLYRSQFLQAFHLHVYDDQTIKNTCYWVYDKIKSNVLFKNIIQKGPFYDSKDLVFSFMMLFNYETFDLIHRCIIEEIEKDGLKEESECYQQINRILENNDYKETAKKSATV
jgi:hypothetical protein